MNSQDSWNLVIFILSTSASLGPELSVPSSFACASSVQCLHSEDVLVQAAITKYHRMHGLDNRCLFLTVQETRYSRPKCQLVPSS